MRRLTLGFCILLLVCLTISPLAAQSRGASSGGDSGRGAPAGAVSTSVTPSSVSTSSYSGYSSSSYSMSGIGNRGFGSSGNTGGSYSTGINLQGTSFYSYSQYADWNNYYLYLNRYYNLNSLYFTRFYYNREPLVTPAMMRLTLRQPLFISTQMLRLIDEIEIMYRDSLEGKAIDKNALIDKAQAIRRLAKTVRTNRSLSLMDIRDDKDVYNEDDFNSLSIESVAKLREMARELNRQLTEMIAQSSSATISVQRYQEPSFESLSRGIEKACKAIEHSTKRL